MPTVCLSMKSNVFANTIEDQGSMSYVAGEFEMQTVYKVQSHCHTSTNKTYKAEDS